MKCFKCGSEFFVPPCPTCERNRKLEEQNRLAREQNRILEEQNKEAARSRSEQEKQTQILKDQMDFQERERQRHEKEFQQQKMIEQSKILAQKLKDEFQEKFNDLFRFATERNLILFYVFFQDVSLDITKHFTNYIDNEDLYRFFLNDIGLLFKEECEKIFTKLTDTYNSDDRYLNADKYHLFLEPKFKLGDIKQTIINHTTDYVIMKTTGDPFCIFPLELISNINTKVGYDGKEIYIGGFTHLFYLYNNEEAEKITTFLSNFSKYIQLTENNLIKLLLNTIIEYEKINPKPMNPSSTPNNLSSVPEYIEADLKSSSEKKLLKAYRKEYAFLYWKNREDSGAAKLLCSVITILLALPFLLKFFDSIFWDNVIYTIIIPVAIAIFISLMSAFIPNIAGFFIGIISLVFSGWLLFNEGTNIVILMAIPAVVGPIVGLLFYALLNYIKVFDKDLFIKDYKEARYNNWKKEMESNEEIALSYYKEQIINWHTDLKNLIKSKAKNFFTSQKFKEKLSLN